MSSKYEPGVWYEWGGGPNPVPGMRVDVRFKGGSEASGLSETWSSVWRDAASVCDIIAFRPALSPPAEGDMIAPRMKRQRDQAQAERVAEITARTPTPAPVDHIGDATEMIDWERVGPKLVEALEEVRTRAKVMRNSHKLVGPRAFENDPRGRKAWADDRYAEGKDLMKLIRPALAAAQPEAK